MRKSFGPAVVFVCAVSLNTVVPLYAQTDDSSVTVNRTAPEVTAPPTTLTFSDAPTKEEIFRARVFDEPVVPVGGEPTDEDTAALASALRAFHDRVEPGWIAPLGDYLTNHPDSPWEASLLANIGMVYRNTAAYTHALEVWEQAWELTKDSHEPYGQAVADYAISNWMEVMASFGQADAVLKRFEDLRGRDVRGAAGARLAQALETAHFISKYPEQVIASGPEALRVLFEQAHGAETPRPAALASYQPTAAGTSLAEIAVLAESIGLPLRAARHADADEVPVPSVMHWKLGHFSAIVERNGSSYRIIDVALGGEIWISESTLLDQTSGYFLVPTSASETAWPSVAAEEGATVIGHSCPPNSPATQPPPPDQPPPPNKLCNCGGGSGSSGGGGPNPGGMATYQLEPTSASLQLADIPLSYTPPRGPEVIFRVTYQQRDLLQPQIFTYANVGRMWSFEWQRFLQEVPQAQTCFSTCDPAHVWVHFAGSWDVSYDSNADGTYDPSWRSRAVVVLVSASPVRYERRFPDGSVEVYAFPDGAASGSRRIFLTDVIDPQGQTLHFTWDAQFRVVAITDAIGQVTTISYEDSSNPLRVTKVTDPFGRFAILQYTASGQLASITDVIGLTSSFVYGASGFVSALTTPYGKTVFRHEDDWINSMAKRMVEATDPLGDTEHLEFEWQTAGMAPTAPASEVPTGFETANKNLDHYNTFYWDKLAWKTAPNDKTKAIITHWLGKSEFTVGPTRVVAAHSVKRPLEGRVWYACPGQPTPETIGWLLQPIRVARVLDDGLSQVTDITYNDQGQVLTITDPVGRRTSYTYATNGIDLLEVRNTTGTLNDLLSQYGSYTTSHRAQTMTDAAGQSTTFTFNAEGQILTVTNAKQETTTYAYNANGQLLTITGPVAGATTTFTYDVEGRIRTMIDADSYTVTTDYDAFDRPTRVTYPDGTYEEMTYSRLDRATSRDRLGRITRYYYDALRRLVSTRDALGRVIQQEWCTCGSLTRLIDANGHATSWERDVQGRVSRELRADGHATQYTYETTTSRLKSVTDPKLEVTSYTYYADDQLKDTLFTNEQIATPDLSFTYDPAYRQLASMIDGTGTTSYAYHPVGSVGAAKLASVDGPLVNDTIAYTYDELGRVTNRAINSVGVMWAFDALSRTTSEVSVLGSFTYTYDGTTNRLATVTYPNGQTSTYTYFANDLDHRLQTIHHKYPGGATLSRFDYTYNTVGDILSWRQQVDATAVNWTYDYDAADQLTAAAERDTNPQATLLNRFAYGYDAAGNRTVEQIDNVVTGATYNQVNELISQQPSGAMVFVGSVNEPATVTIAGTPAVVATDKSFRGIAPIASGTNTVTVTARDASGNAATQQFQVTNDGVGTTFSYDANGNLISDGTRTFEWDARNQLVAINIRTHRSEFTYDGRQRRVRIVEKESGVVQSDTKVLWCAADICEERAGDGSVIRRLFDSGEQLSDNQRYFTTDHLSSVRVVTDAAALLVAQYDCDPWGRRTSTTETTNTNVAFTGHLLHNPSATYMTMYREYDPALARWLSPDPIGVAGGPNLYAYALSNPERYVDPYGLDVNNPGWACRNVCSHTSKDQYGMLDLTKYEQCVVKCQSDLDWVPRPTYNPTGATYWIKEACRMVLDWWRSTRTGK